MLRGPSFHARSLLPRPLSTHRLPLPPPFPRHSPLLTRHFALSPFFPLDTRVLPVSPLFPLDAKTVGATHPPRPRNACTATPFLSHISADVRTHPLSFDRSPQNTGGTSLPSTSVTLPSENSLGNFPVNSFACHSYLKKGGGGYMHVPYSYVPRHGGAPTFWSAAARCRSLCCTLAIQATVSARMHAPRNGSKLPHSKGLRAGWRFPRGARIAPASGNEQWRFVPRNTIVLAHPGQHAWG
jgi:hypothetical protein